MNSFNSDILNYLKADNIFEIISATADELSVETYIVGGYVRDIILKRDLRKDVDIMCVGSGIDLAKAFHKKLKPNVTPSKINIYKRFGTAMISHNNFKIEFVGARKESYSKDSRNPSTKPGNFMDCLLYTSPSPRD